MHKALNVVLILLLLGATAALYKVYHYAERYYRDLNVLRLHPQELYKINMAEADDDVGLVFYGDSRAHGWIVPDWLIGKTFNAAIGSQTTQQILSRFDQHVAPLNAKIVLVQAGVNDLKVIPLIPKYEKDIIATCKNNLTEIVNQSVANGAHVVITTIFPTGTIPISRKLVWSGKVDMAIDEVNSYIRTLASENVTVIETGPVLAGDSNRVKAEYARDALHLNATGYAALNAVLKAPVTAILNDNN